MKLRTRLNLVLIGLTAVSVGVLIVDELHDMRSSIREEIEAANRVAAHLLGSLALTDSSADGLAAVREQLQKLGHVRANDITLRTASGEVLYRAPPPVYKAGREALCACESQFERQRGEVAGGVLGEFGEFSPVIASRHPPRERREDVRGQYSGRRARADCR